MRHRALLSGAHLNDADTETLVGVLGTFSVEYQAVSKTYTDDVKNAIVSDQGPDVASFLAKRNALVQGVRDKLESTLTGPGMSNLDNFVQGEKRQMKIQ